MRLAGSATPHEPPLELCLILHDMPRGRDTMIARASDACAAAFFGMSCPTLFRRNPRLVVIDAD